MICKDKYMMMSLKLIEMQSFWNTYVSPIGITPLIKVIYIHHICYLVALRRMCNFLEESGSLKK